MIIPSRKRESKAHRERRAYHLPRTVFPLSRRQRLLTLRKRVQRLVVGTIRPSHVSGLEPGHFVSLPVQVHGRRRRRRRPTRKHRFHRHFGFTLVCLSRSVRRALHLVRHDALHRHLSAQRAVSNLISVAFVDSLRVCDDAHEEGRPGNRRRLCVVNSRLQ